MQELDERGLAAVLCANDEDAAGLLATLPCWSGAAYLKGVGSFLRRTRRGLLTVLIWLLA